MIFKASSRKQVSKHKRPGAQQFCHVEKIISAIFWKPICKQFWLSWHEVRWCWKSLWWKAAIVKWETNNRQESHSKEVCACMFLWFSSAIFQSDFCSSNKLNLSLCNEWRQRWPVVSHTKLKVVSHAATPNKGGCLLFGNCPRACLIHFAASAFHGQTLSFH